MGLTAVCMHIYGDIAPQNCGFHFQSFSPNWLTCVDELAGMEEGSVPRKAKQISKQLDAPVLLFGIFDSDMIWLEIYCKGKKISSYSDEFYAGKGIYDVPAMVGYEAGQKRRFSQILACMDIERKIAMLEEYFGVCLLYLPEMEENTAELRRDRSDALYRVYQAEEKALTGKNAPMGVRLIGEYPGKLFEDLWGQTVKTVKPHCFLYGYASANPPDGRPELTPVRFEKGRLEQIDLETFRKDREPRRLTDARFKLEFGPTLKVTFSEECSEEYRGKTILIPNDYFPLTFLPSGELVLCERNRICVMDHTGKIVAKLSVKGDVADIQGYHVLTTIGDSFYLYMYEPNAKIRIYEIVKK